MSKRPRRHTLLDGFISRHNDYYAAIAAAITALEPRDQLALLGVCDTYSATNCSWIAYETAQHFRTALPSREHIQRKLDEVTP